MDPLVLSNLQKAPICHSEYHPGRNILIFNIRQMNISQGDHFRVSPLMMGLNVCQHRSFHYVIQYPPGELCPVKWISAPNLMFAFLTLCG